MRRTVDRGCIHDALHDARQDISQHRAALLRCVAGGMVTADTRACVLARDGIMRRASMVIVRLESAWED